MTSTTTPATPTAPGSSLLGGDAVYNVAALAKAAGRTEILNVTGEHPAHFWATTPDGKLARMAKVEPPRRHKAMRLVDVRKFVKDYVAAGALGEEQRVSVWCWRGSVTAVLDDNEHRLETVTLSAPDSGAYKTLEGLARSGEWLDQVQFLRLLKVDLYGCVGDGFIDLMRQLKFSASTAGEGNIQAGRESLGLSIQREALAGGAAMPEEVVVRIPVYQDLIDGEDDWDVFVAEVVCVLSVDYGNRKLKLEPIPDEMTRVKRQADEWIFAKMKDIEGAKVVVYCGAPQ